MKRIIALLLSLVMLVPGHGKAQSQPPLTNESGWVSVEPQYKSLDDPQLLGYIEDLVYRDAIVALNSDEYVVENVSAVYISKEYLDEVAFNSQANIYFGYTLAELDDLFQGTKYIFTLGSDGTTTVEELLEIESDPTKTMIRNVAIGTGVILVCVTVSVVSSAVGLSAVSAFFAASAKTATTYAVSFARFGGITAGVVKGVQTGDFDEAVEAAALGASEGFKWGAISGAICGAINEAKSGGFDEPFLLEAGTRSGLTMNEVALIQQESTLPMDVIEQIHSWDEYLIYKEAGLKPMMVNGKTALIQNIDSNYVSQLADGTEVTNLVRMQKGLAPLDPLTGKAYQLHHVGQKADGTLAVLTESQHQGNSAVLHIFGKDPEMNRSEFAKTRKEFWEYLGKSEFAKRGN